MNLFIKIRIQFLIPLFLMVGFLSAEEIILVKPNNFDSIQKTAVRELKLFLSEAYPEDQFFIREKIPESGKFILIGTLEDQPILKRYLDPKEVEKPGQFLVNNIGNGNIGIICGNHPRAVLDGVYAILEELGYAFYLEHTIHPKPKSVFSLDSWNLKDRPLVQERMVMNWHNFLSGCSGWDIEHYEKWIRQVSRMGHNGIILHFYGNNPAFQFSYNGQIKEVGYMGATHKGPEWGVPLLNDVRRLPGAHFLNHSVFSSKVALVEDKNRVDAAVHLLQNAFRYAENFGMKIHLAVDMDHHSCNPPNIVQTLPGKVRFKNGTLVRPDQQEGYDYYKNQVRTLLETYPELDTIIVWSRGEWTDWMTIKYEDLPIDWREEYDRLKVNYPELVSYHKLYKNDKGPAHFAYSKVTTAFLSIVKELGREDVKIGYGGWWDRTGSQLWRLHNFVEDPEISLWVKDYNRAFRWPDIRKIYKEISQTRSIYPIDWAQHDDGHYVGRPFQPHENFSDMLKESEVPGYAIVHWMTWPLDLFFKNLMRQAWESSKNENYKETCYTLADHFFGKEYKTIMGDYLKDWWTNAPSFGYSTSANYMNLRLKKGGPIIPNILKDADKHHRSTRDRIQRLESIQVDSMSKQAKKFFNYFLMNEKFIYGVADSSLKLTEAKNCIQKGDIERARAIMKSSRHTETVQDFAKASQALGPSRGEEGHLVRIGSVWLYSYDYICAKLGLYPIGYNFGPIPMDKYAIGAVNQKFHFDQKGFRWAVHDGILIQNGGKILRTRASGVIVEDGKPIDTTGFTSSSLPGIRSGLSSDEEIAESYVERSSTITLQLKAVTEDLVSGVYDLDLYFPASVVQEEGQRILKVSFNNTSQEFDLYGDGSILKKISFPSVKVSESKLIVEISGLKGNAIISGAKLMFKEDA